MRSALVGVRYSGSGGAPGGRLVLTDRPDYCETLRLRREAEARGESLLLDTEHSTLVLFLSGTRLEPGALRAGTYAVNAGSGGGYTMLPLQVEGGLFRVTADELRASIAVAGKVAFDQRVSFREGAEVSGRLSLMFDRDQQETLEGEFTATYCESL